MNNPLLAKFRSILTYAYLPPKQLSPKRVAHSNRHEDAEARHGHTVSEDDANREHRNGEISLIPMTTLGSEQKAGCTFRYELYYENRIVYNIFQISIFPITSIF